MSDRPKPTLIVELRRYKAGHFAARFLQHDARGPIRTKNFLRGSHYTDAEIVKALTYELFGDRLFSYYDFDFRIVEANHANKPAAASRGDSPKPKRSRRSRRGETGRV